MNWQCQWSCFYCSILFESNNLRKFFLLFLWFLCENFVFVFSLRQRRERSWLKWSERHWKFNLIARVAGEELCRTLLSPLIESIKVFLVWLPGQYQPLYEIRNVYFHCREQQIVHKVLCCYFMVPDTCCKLFSALWLSFKSFSTNRWNSRRALSPNLLKPSSHDPNSSRARRRKTLNNFHIITADECETITREVKTVKINNHLI